MQAGGRRIQQQVHGEGGLVLLLSAAEDAGVVQHRGPPDPHGVQTAAAGHPRMGLLVHEDAVADLLGQPQHDAAVQLPVLGVVGAVPVGLQLRLFGQMLCFRGGGLFGAGDTGGEPEMAPQMIAGAKFLLGLAQPFRRVEGAPETALDVGAVFGGVLPEGDVGQPLVHRQPAAACGIHRAGVLDHDAVGLDHLGGERFGGKRSQKPFEMQVERGFFVHGAVKQLRVGKEGQQGRFQRSRFRRRLRGQRGGKVGFVRGHHRRAAALHGAPAVCLHGVDELVFGHPLLPGELVLDAEKVVRMGAAQLGQHRAAGQLQCIGCAFEVEPGQVVEFGLPDVAIPKPEQAPDEIVAVIFVHQAHDAVHVEIDRAVGVVCKEQRLKPIGTGCRPDLIGCAPLFGGVALRFHQRNSFAAVSCAGMRAAMTSRISPCS